ncbi:hypothetical protein [Streptomyces alanosinicus]|uniref:Big-1 domain-containing protein n=1 Tax=Streptomyces alanosinicus TaxID=68171 RepID=A0A918YH82_9ACTN|nr:hypothetical protein [Streptomyces alanosinicus]GHE03983.1 hypothetical protein GCM10010339_33650 [Streptomyces alanosinicus]
MTTQADLEQFQKFQEFMKWQQMQGGQQPGGSTASVATPVVKKHVRLEATATKGTVVGQATGTVKATLRDTDGEPLQDKEIVFILTTSRQELGRTATDPNGVAQLSAGSNIGDPQLWIEALGTGFTAQFAGTKEYYPAEAKATVRASIF